MPEWYRVKYTLGSSYGETLVYAHNDKEAETIAEIQVKCSRKSRAKFEIVAIGKDGENTDSLMKQLEPFKVRKA